MPHYVQLTERVAEFKEVAGREPLLLVPGRPPKPLVLDSPLLEAGIRAGESKVGGWVGVQARRAGSISINMGLGASYQPIQVHVIEVHVAHKQVGITAAFPELELLPTAAAEQVPSESNPALLRWA